MAHGAMRPLEKGRNKAGRELCHATGQLMTGDCATTIAGATAQDNFGVLLILNITDTPSWGVDRDFQLASDILMLDRNAISAHGLLLH